ncbi:nucleopolyhedrovirus P10 family protein [Streptomyces luteireticuli]|uniref:Nucleopolyhedrovirus P10 family protein n=1 Tax=Streptomyces luteireticuli TaxID=173858 RepID=A0ABN0Z611_9ACTN
MDGARAVRRQLALGRLLPLGGAEGGTWIAEAAAGAVLRAVPMPTGVRLGMVRLDRSPAAPVTPGPVPVPPGALPAGPLRISVELAADPGEPLPVVAGRVREALIGAAEGWVGLVVEGVDVRVVESVRAVSPPEVPVLSGSLPVPGVAAASAVGEAVTWIGVEEGARVLDVARAVRGFVGGAVIVAAVGGRG